jgi:hypothetical protein
MCRAISATYAHEQDQRILGIVIALVFGLSSLAAYGQASNEITAVDPSSAEPGTTGLVVTFTLDTDTPAAPPPVRHRKSS